jgi:CHAD domain-containing protein
LEATVATPIPARSSRPKGTDQLEIEWRFDAPDLAAAASWLAGRDPASSNVTVAEGKTKGLSDTYHDTRDWRVYRAGYALRVREGEGPAGGFEVTFKSLASEDGPKGESKRREVTETHRGNARGAIEVLRGSRGPAGELLRTFAGVREAPPIFALRNRRRTFDLVLHEDAPENGGLVVDALGDIRERGSGAAGNGPAEAAGVTVDAADDVREDEAGAAQEPGVEAAENGGLVVDASGNIRERRVSDGSSDGRAGGPSEKRAGGRVVGEVALDETEILVGEGEEPVRLSRVEVEVGAGEADSALETVGAFVAEMGGALGLKPTRLSKYAAGLFAVGQSPEAATDLGPTRVDDSVTLGELAFAVLRRQFGTMRSHEPGVRVGEDPEELHDMRVATRRMRAAIKLFKKALPERARHLRDEMKWVATVLGDVRDLDVQLERLEEWSARADDDGYRDTLRRTSRLLEKQRKEARDRMLEALDSARYERFERSFAEMLKLGPTPSLTPGAAADEDSPNDEPAAVAGRGLLRRRYRKWRKLADAIDDASAPEEYHELRKEGKRLRYALEFFAEVYGEDVTGRLVKPLKTFQDDLGLHQDDLVAAEWLREMVTDNRRFPSKAAFFVGMLVGDCLREAAGIRDRMRDNKAFLAVADGKEWEKFQMTISKKPGIKK